MPRSGDITAAWALRGSVQTLGKPVSFYVEDRRIVVSRSDYTTPLPPWLDAKSCVHAALTTLVWDSKAGKWLC